MGSVASNPQAALPFALSPLPPVASNLANKSCILVSNGLKPTAVPKVQAFEDEDNISIHMGGKQ